MAKVKVRCLLSLYIPSVSQTFGFNDELELERSTAEILKSQGYVDILGEEALQVAEAEVIKKPRRRATKKTGEE